MKEIKISFLACVGLGMGLYIGKELGREFMETGVPLLRKFLTKEM